jgi:phage terminase small subunit
MMITGTPFVLPYNQTDKREAVDMEKLTDRQKVFCREYLIDLNASKAAVRAGYRPQNARICACKLMARPLIKAEIKKLMREREKRLNIAAEDIIKELMIIAKANAADFVQVTTRKGRDSEGNPTEVSMVRIKPTDEIDSEKIAALAGVRQRVCGVEVKLYDKLKAIELLMRHLGLLNNKADEEEKVIRVEIAEEIKEWAK